MKNRDILRVSCVSLAVSFACFAHAEGENRAAAIAAFDAAERLVAEGQLADACPKYAESYRLDPQLGALLHTADCYEKAGRYASAWAAFQEGQELADRRRDNRASVAKQRMKQLEPKLSRLSIIVPESAKVDGLEIRRNGAAVGVALWGTAIPVDPGAHTLEASAPGRKPWRGSVTVSGQGQTQTFTLVPLETFTMVNLDNGSEPRSAATVQAGSSTGSTLSTPAADTSVTNDDPGRTQRLLGWSAVAAGGVGAAVGLVFYLKRSSKLGDRDDVCPEGVCTQSQYARVVDLTDEARSASTAATISFIAGGALAAGGAALVLTAPKQRATIAAAPILTPELFGAGVTGRW